MAHHDSGDEVNGARRTPSAALFGAAVALGAALLCGALSRSIGSLVFFVSSLSIFVCPGFFLVQTWFSGSERLLVGAAVGFLVNSLVASVLYQCGYLSPWSTAAASVLVTVGLIWGQRNRPARKKERFQIGKGLAASMFLILVLVTFPFLRVGEPTEEGVAYRAYFSADLMTHLSVVAELQKESVPPKNPFYAGEPLGYYWLFFLFPALVGKWTGNQEALLLTYLAGGLLFGGLAFCAVRRLASTPGRAFIAVFAGLAAASYEGVSILFRSFWAGGSFRDLNVDAFSRWVFELTSLDGLHRSLLYTPQHLFSYSLLLILILLVVRGDSRGLALSSFVGLLLGGMAGTSIVTAMLAGPWWAGVRVASGGDKRSLVRDLIGMGLVSSACLGWYFVLGFFGEAGAALVLRRPRFIEVPAILILECGALVLLSLPAWFDRRALPWAVLASMSLLAVLGLDIRGYEGVWMAWRAGSVFLVSLMLLAALGVERWSRSAVAWILVPATLTAGFDIYNAQDTSNRGLSAGEFRWTTVIRQGELDALRWLRAETEPQCIVQWDSRARPAGEWALVPALAERRMAVGFPIFLLEREKYRRRERRWVRPVFVSEDPAVAHRLAVDAEIDYIFVGRRELEIRGDRLRKFWESPSFFETVFSNRDVSIFRVLR